MRDQQLLECQQRIEEVSRQHKAAIDEGTTLQQQVELLNKLAKSWHIVLLWKHFSISTEVQIRLVTCVRV